MFTKLNKCARAVPGRGMLLLGASSLAYAQQGVVFAEESASQSSPPPPKKKSKKKRGKKGKKKAGQNPGTFSEAGRAISDVVEVQTFQGIKVSKLLPLFIEEQGGMGQSNAKQVFVGSTVNMGSPSDPEGSSVEFTTQAIFFGGQYFLISQSKLGVQGQDGVMNGRALYKPKKSPLSASLQASIHPDASYNNVVFETDYKGSDFTAGFSAMSGMQIASYLQQINPNWSAGMQGYRNDPGSWLNYAVRYSNAQETAFVNYAARGPSTCGYSRNVGKILTLASEFSAAAESGESSMKAGALYKYKTFQFRGLIDSTGKVTSLLETRDPTTGWGYHCCAELNHATNESTFGFALDF